MKKVSIIVPIYKGNYYIPNLIRMLEDNWTSVNRDCSVQIELILVNDYPNEKLDIRKTWMKNILLTVIENEKNQGIHFSRVQGLLQARGDFILFFDQDDEISSIYLREQLKAMGEHDAVICNGKNRSNLIYKNSAELYRATDVGEYKQGYNRIVSPGQVLIKKKAIPKEWTEHILIKNGADDYFLWMLMIWKKCDVVIQDKVLYWHLIWDENTSNDSTEMDASVLEMTDKLKEMECLTYEEEQRIRKSRSIVINKIELSYEGYQKEREYKKILELWMVLRDKKISVDMFLAKRHIKKVAIYGGGILGKHLYCELKESDIKVICFLDKNKKAEVMGIECISPGDSMQPVDVIIVTPFMEYLQIRNQLKKQYPYNILSIETVLLNADCLLETDDMELL